MAIVKRIFAAAALFSLALVSAPDGVDALSVQHGDIHGRSHHHELAANIKRANEPRASNQRRCKPRPTTSLTSTAPATTSKKPVENVEPTPKPVTTTSKPPTTTSTTSKAAATTKASSGGSGGSGSSGGGSPSGSGKVGLAWSNGEDNNLYQYVTSKTHYLYTWSPNCPSQAAKLGLNCARMLWGPKQTSSFRSLRTSAGTNVLMGMNEVNEPSQANMTPGDGINLWNAEIRPYGSKGYKLISPSVTSAPSGVKWFQDFFAGCGGNDKCGVDALSIHYYGTEASAFKSYVNKFHDTFGLNIWVTEFACQNFSGSGGQCSKDDVWSFMESVTSWMDSTSWVEAYFAFGLLHDMWNVNYDNQLMNGDGSPTDLGYYFINA